MKRKTLLLPFIIYNSNIKYFFRIMRISLFLLFVCVFQLMAEEADAQNAEIKLSQNSMTIKQLVKEIEAQTDYLVVFRDQDVDVNKTVSFNTKTATVADYLEMITKNTGISYQFENNYITLLSTSSKSVNQEKKKKISGQIVDTYGLAVIGANVVEKGTTNGTITDVDGNFSLEVDENSTLVVSYIGYTPQEIIVANKSNFSIKLKEDTEVLDEVVVVGYGTAKKKDLTGAVSSVKAEKLSAQAPRNVQDILRSNAAGLNIGIATDGDADRLGVIDNNGRFLHPNDILVLLYYYLLKYKGWSGPVVRNIATTELLDRVAKSFGEKCYEVPVGFKHISGKMIETDAIIGGESSGGLTVKGHIQGKDGVYAASLLVEMIAVTGKSLSEIYEDICNEYGKLYMTERDYKMSQKRKEELIDQLMVKREGIAFNYDIDRVSYDDGYKVYFKNGGWVIVRFSGTEPVLRVFAEMDKLEKAEEIAKVVEATLGL